MSARYRWSDSTKSTWKIVALLGLIAIVIGCVGSVGSIAQTIDVHLGFGGVFVHGRWSPISIDVAAGPKPFAGHVEIQVPRTTLLSVEPTYVTISAPVDAESRTTKRLRLTLPLQAAPHPMLARLINSAGDTVDSREISLKEGAAAGRLTLVLDPSGEPWSWLTPSGMGGPANATVTNVARAGDLSADPLALSSASTIVIKDDFPLDSFSPSQLSALRDYVRFGGHLVFTGGSTPPIFPKGLSEWLPLLPTGRVVPVAADWGAVPAWQIDAPGHGAPRSVGEPPLVVTESVGAGRVTFIAIDPTAPSSRSLLAPDVWAAELLGGRTPSWIGASLTHQEEMWRVLGRARIDSPPPTWLAAALGAYVAVVIGALALARRMRAALWTTLLLAVIVSVTTWIYSSRISIAGRTAHAEFQVIQGIEDGVAVNRTYGIIASRSPVPFDLEVMATAPTPFPGATGRSSVEVTVTPDGIRFDSVRPGESVRFMHENLEPFPVRARIDREERSSVHIENGGDVPLQFAYLVGSDWFTPLGTIEAGSTVTAPIPQTAKGSAGFVALSIQSQLERLDSSTRPTSLEARLIAYAVGQALDDALFAGRRDLPLLVALTRPEDVVTTEPSGHRYRRRVMVAPFVEEVERGDLGAT